jgi:WS/DGAT/MGAT family acyltransferase
MLEYQRPNTSLWTESAWLLTFDGSSPTIAELREQVASSLPLLPPLREKVRYSKLALLRPRWTRDPDFDLSWHVREADASRFRSEEGWLRLADELLGSPLDRERPLWRIWLVPDNENERFALVFHLNHALADGHSALNILRLLLAEVHRGHPTSRPNAPRKPNGLRARLDQGLEAARSVVAAARLLYPPAPAVPSLNRPLGPRRRTLTVDVPMRKVMDIATGWGCFPNDVYLTAVAGGLRCWLDDRGEAPPELTLQAGIPIKTRSRADRQGLGNHFSGIRLPLPLGEGPHLARLRRIQNETKKITVGRIARGGELMGRVHDFLPRQLLTPLARMEWGPKAINLVISHLALPGDLQQCLGRPLTRLYCWTPLFEDHTISVVAAQGLNGTMTINLLVEPDLVPDASTLKVGILETIEVLHAALAGEVLTAGRS